TFPLVGDKVRPAVTSVNHAPRNRVGSTASVALALPRCHHARARRCSAVTDGCHWMPPHDGPPPTPTPHADFDHNTSMMPCAAAVPPPLLRAAAVPMPSTPKRRCGSPSGALAAHRSVRTWPYTAPSGSEASAPVKFAVKVGAAYRKAGVSDTVLSVDPPG